MTAYERMERIRRCIEIAFPNTSTPAGDRLSLELNSLRLMSDDERRRRAGPNPPSGKYVARWAGHLVEGETVDDAVEALETKVFGVLLDHLNDDIKNHETRARDLRLLRETLNDAMRGR